jgi:nucleoside-diphosphate-sugar epimerase
LEKSKDISFDELSEALKKGHAFTVENIDLYGEDADIDKAKQELGWTPEANLNQIIFDSWQGAKQLG